MLLSIRGTNGSGKSTLAKRLISENPSSLHYGVLGPRRPEATRLNIRGVTKPVYVLGPYHVASGGCDQIQPYDLILELLERYAAKGHVVFEGVIVSSSYGRVGRLMEKWGQEAVMAFLNTSLEQCIENVKKRRGAKGDNREFNPKNLTSKYNQILDSREKIRAAGTLRVVELELDTAYNQILSLLKEAK